MPDYSSRTAADITTASTDGGVVEPVVEQEMGNGAVAEMLTVSGALGRTFNRIAGVSEGNTSAEGLGFTSADLKRYLDEQLSFAQGEWFRGTKIDGVADKIMSNLDADKDGTVSWMEFQTMLDEMRSQLVGDVGADASKSAVQAKANALFAEVSQGRESVDFETIEARTLEKLPEDMDHQGLVAQLAALMVIDIVDLDEAEKGIRDRSLNETEWMSAVGEVTGSG